MTIYLVRHGESKSNYDNKHFRSYFCGQLDVPLTDTGTKSADDLCDYFKEKQIKHVYVSDLLRTQKAPEGESYEDVYQRVEHFMNHVVNEDTQKDDIVIVAHQVVIRCLMVYFNKVSRAEAVDLKVENCKPYIIE